MAAAKSFFPEDHPQFAGIYWGEVSAPERARLSTGRTRGLHRYDFQRLLDCRLDRDAERPRVLTADKNRVYFDGHDFGGIHLRDFLSRPGPEGAEARHDIGRISTHPPPAAAATTAEPDAKLKRAEIFRQIASLITADTTVIAETGDSWFNGMRLKLPGGARFEIEMQWGSIGWSVPATFGYAVGAPSRRVIALIGDGSFQLTAQEVAQMVRRKLPVIIFLINNHGYTIEVEIHDGPYNNIKNWDYAGLIQVFNAEEVRAAASARPMAKSSRQRSRWPSPTTTGRRLSNASSIATIARKILFPGDARSRSPTPGHLARSRSRDVKT